MGARSAGIEEAPTTVEESVSGLLNKVWLEKEMCIVNADKFVRLIMQQGKKHQVHFNLSMGSHGSGKLITVPGNRVSGRDISCSIQC